MPPTTEDLLSISDADDLRKTARFVLERMHEAGEAEALGADPADIDDLEHDLDAELIASSRPDEDLAVYRSLDGTAVLVGRFEGRLWMAELAPGPLVPASVAAEGVFSDQDYEYLQDMVQTGGDVGGPLDRAFPFADQAGDRGVPSPNRPRESPMEREERALDPTRGRRDRDEDED